MFAASWEVKNHKQSFYQDGLDTIFMIKNLLGHGFSSSVAVIGKDVIDLFNSLFTSFWNLCFKREIPS